MKIERYRGRVIGWRTRAGRRFLIDALTARAVRLSKRVQAVGEQAWMCGAFSRNSVPWRCSLPSGHGGEYHMAKVDGVEMARWRPRG